MNTTFIQRLFPAAVLFFSFAGHAQVRIDFHRERSTTYATASVYSVRTGELRAYIQKENGWEENAEAPKLPVTVTKQDVHIDFHPETSTTYATATVYSGQTGEFQAYILKENGWEKNVEASRLPVTVTKQDVHIDFHPETSTTYATATVYSAQTGEFQAYIQKENGWEKNVEASQLPVTVAKQDVRIDFRPETSTTYATATVYSARTGEFQAYIQKENGWQKNVEASQLPVTVAKQDVHIDFQPETSTTYATAAVYSGKTGEFECYILKENGWEKSIRASQFPMNVTKEDMHIDFEQESSTHYASAAIYSGKTGEFEYYILKENGWEKSTEVSKLPVTIR